MAVAAPLSSAYERKPVNERPKMAPFAGLPHRVRTGENWGTLAKYYGYASAADLIQYNFGTTVPQEVNWYLREHVGCNVATPDKKNWRFTDSASPGVIYIHADNMAKVKPLPVAPPAPVQPPKPVLPPPPVVPAPPFVLTYRIPNVPHFYQGKTNLCWAHSAAMMFSWRHKRKHTPEQTMEFLGEEFVETFQENKGPSNDKLELLLDLMALTREPNACLTPIAWFEGLAKSGPLLLLNRPSATTAHMFVLTGIKAYDAVDGRTATYYVNDSAYSGPVQYTSQQFTQRLELLGDVDTRIRVAHYGGRW